MKNNNSNNIKSPIYRYINKNLTDGRRRHYYRASYF